MNMKWKNYVECERTNITPREFYRYVLKRAEEKGMKDYFPVENYSDWENPPCSCKSHYTKDRLGKVIGNTTIQPFKIHIWRTGEFNMVLEFNFYDEKKGFGYMCLSENQSE